MHATADKQGKVTDVTIWRAGFMEEREVLVGVSATAGHVTAALIETMAPIGLARG
jgi:malic enzyme